MNAPITIGDMLFVMCLFVGVVMTVGGAVTTYGGMMADAQDRGTSRRGCSALSFGLLLSAGGLWGLLS